MCKNTYTVLVFVCEHVNETVRQREVDPDRERREGGILYVLGFPWNNNTRCRKISGAVPYPALYSVILTDVWDL